METEEASQEGMASRLCQMHGRTLGRTRRTLST